MKTSQTNNLAERSLRKLVIYRKKVFFWSNRGERFLERILSLDLTSRLRNEKAFEKLYDLVK